MILKIGDIDFDLQCLSRMILKIGDVDFDLQCQIGLQTSKIFILTLNIEPLQILTSSLNCLSRI